MKKLYDALLKVKEDPHKYIGNKSITLLDNFIVGYILSHSDETCKYPVEFDGFQKFVQQKYNITYSVRYSQIIRCFSFSQELAFDQFYKLLEEYYKKQFGK